MKIKYVALLILIAAVSGGCVQKKQATVQKPAQAVNQPANLPTTLPSNEAQVPPSKLETTGAADTSNWKAYRNNKFGFELKYPAEWNVSKIDESRATPQQLAQQDNTVMIGELFDAEGRRIAKELPEGIGIVIMEGQNPTKLSTKEWFNQDIYTNPPAETRGKLWYTPYTTVDGIEMYLQQSNPPSMPAILFTHNDDLYTISNGLLFFGGPSQIEGRFDAILSSINFD